LIFAPSCLLADLPFALVIVRQLLVALRSNGVSVAGVLSRDQRFVL